MKSCRLNRGPSYGLMEYRNGKKETEGNSRQWPAFARATDDHQ